MLYVPGQQAWSMRPLRQTRHLQGNLLAADLNTHAAFNLLHREVQERTYGLSLSHCVRAGSSTHKCAGGSPPDPLKCNKTDTKPTHFQ